MKWVGKLLIGSILLWITAVPGYSAFNRISADASAETMLETAAVASEANRVNYYAIPWYFDGLSMFAYGIGMYVDPWQRPFAYVPFIFGAGFSGIGFAVNMWSFPAEGSLKDFRGELEQNKDWTQEQRDERALYYLQKAAKGERIWSIVGGSIDMAAAVSWFCIGCVSYSLMNASAYTRDFAGRYFFTTFCLPSLVLTAEGVVQAFFMKAPAELALERYNKALKDKGSAKVDFYFVPIPGNTSAGVYISF